MQTQAIFNNIAESIEQEISKAQNSIYVAVAWFTNQNLFNALLQKAKSGCKVNVIVVNDEINQNSAIDYLLLNIQNSKANMLGDGSQNLIHHKFCVIDHSTVITGSYNWSYKAETSNKENIIITEGDAVLAEQFINEFNNILNAFAPKDNNEVEVLPINQILKRLEILKNYIMLEDVEEINNVANKIQQFNFNDDVSAIISKVETKQYGNAIEKIEQFINQYSQLTVYINLQIAALKLEIKTLENKVNAFSNEKIELIKVLSDFEHRYTIELGEVILKILQLKKELYKKDEEKFKETEDEEKQFYEQVEEEKQKNIFELNDEEQKELKKKFRKATHLCHPDKVKDELVNEATRVFNELKNAYDTNDLNKVDKILEDLKSGKAFTTKSESINDVEVLKATIEQLKQQIKNLEVEIITIKESDTFETIENIEDWSAYFSDLKERLEEQKQELLDKVNESKSKDML